MENRWTKWLAVISLVVILVIVAYQQTVAAQNRKLDHMLSQMVDSDPTVQAEGKMALNALLDGSLPLRVKVRLIQAAGERSEDPLYAKRTTAILKVIEKRASPSVAAPLAEVFPRLDAEGRRTVLRILTKVDSPEAASQFVALVVRYAPRGQLAPLPVDAWTDEPVHAAALFPAVMELARVPAYSFSVYHLALRYAEEGALKPEALQPYAAQIHDAYLLKKGRLLALQGPPGGSWIQGDEYDSLRDHGALLLDLMRFIPSGESESAAREALAFPDPWLNLPAATTLLNGGREVDAAVLERIAAAPETRNWLLWTLQDMGRASLFPSRYLNQEALAESNLALWLRHPAELGHPPSAMELVSVITDDDPKEGPLDTYLFKFRSDHPQWQERGWMAGVAGPFVRRKQPTTQGLGGTFSEFEPFGSRTPEEHVVFLRKVVEDGFSEDIR